MKLFNTLTRKKDEFKPLSGKQVRIYSCGPTVYDHIHIGNLRSFINADILRRTIALAGYKDVQHVMNFTDVDDKTIKRSQEEFPEDSPETALKKLTDKYLKIFLEEMDGIGNDIGALTFVKATDSVGQMQDLIKKLYDANVAYLADDGIYFSIEKYKKNGKKYGQLLKLDTKNTRQARINNDEYDKDSVHDFALWKLQKPGEPSWEFILNSHKLAGRPGWHIECSAMSSAALSQPFDVHTGGVDLIFPHHENEIAQSTATTANNTYAKYFVHNEHLLVDGKKMSKSLGNFLTLRDIIEKGHEPMAFRVLVLQSHYRSQTNFSWDNLDAASNRLEHLKQFADLRWQLQPSEGKKSALNPLKELKEAMFDDMNTPKVMSLIDEYVSKTNDKLVFESDKHEFYEVLDFIGGVLGLKIDAGPDIDKSQKDLIAARQKARDEKNWAEADDIRNQLLQQKIGIRDTDYGQVWYRL